MKECQLCKNCYTDDVATCPKDGMPTMHTVAGEPVLEGKYHLECRLGQGGMGVVYKARHAFLKTQLAIKIILPDLVGNDPQLITRFRQEALAAAAIRHQNVVGVTDYGVIQGSIPFLVMEYVEGESLHDMLNREKILSPERSLEVISAIAAGVGAAHHQGIVHRDLKPLNIMICTDKSNISQAVKILDFGLAKIKSGELLGSFIQAQTTGLMGSPYYMAPEQWADDEPDSRSDIYSLGVMLFQMLTGDVPFKGSSIPAIMKKHISDPPPTFAELNVPLSIELEQAVRHTLAKEKEKRTPSVEHMIAELKAAIEPVPIGIHTTGGTNSLVSSLNIHTSPPRSKVFVDNVVVGESRDDGWITLNGIQSGNHFLKISHDGFEDWQGDVVCDGRPQQVMAELRSGSATSPKPLDATVAGFNPELRQDTPQNFSATRDNETDLKKTMVQGWETGSQNIAIESIPPKKKLVSPLLLGGLAIAGLFLLGLVGIVGAYMAGLIGRPATVSNVSTPTPSATVSSSPSATPAATPVLIKAEMVEIPGGTFQMGRDGSLQNEAPAHPETVASFWMDKNEVTNAEYLQFVQDAKYNPGGDHVAHWINGKPIPGQEQAPVRFVSIKDIDAFIEWRSKRDKVNYRLPTEKEWEYAARNGDADNLFPWGDTFKPECANVDQAQEAPANVGTKSCPDEWGVMDLIGNVWEWTSSDPWGYPGSSVDIKTPKPHKMVRGGAALTKSTGEQAITSTLRVAQPADMRSNLIGFRLVRSE